MLSDLADRIARSHGWPRRGIASAAGALAALAMPPFGLWPVLALSLPVLVWLIDGASRHGRRAGLRAAFFIGWWFGAFYFLAGLWWIGAAFLVQADDFAWLLPVAVLGLPAGLGLFTGLGCLLARLLWSGGPRRILALAAGLSASEWLRGHVLSGFPWNSFGYGLAADLRFAQAASWLGLWGLGLVTIAALASPATLAGARPRWRAPLLAGLTLAALWGAGAWRLATTTVGEVPGVRLRLMQPDLPQDQKFRFDARRAVVDRYIATSLSEGGLGRVTHLIWPESAFPFFLEREPEALARIAAILPPQTVLVTGAARLGAAPPGSTRPNVYNSLRVIAGGALIADADKVHLVPFGEYLPFQSALESVGLEQLTRLRGGFSAGPARTMLAVPGLPPVAPLICYEAIFPGAVLPQGPRPGLLLNVSNDAWFGMTPGPYQHFAQARLRAVEEGLPLVRGTNNGISALVDPLGRIVGMLPMGARGVLDGPLPTALMPTVYARYGDSIFILLLLFSASARFVRWRVFTRQG
ncbi:MAG TPA: apolipoprotein N-acyltransferase [Xanthobacteraceae bacterium]|nr:apolipoprotein N-acyltransferase [Xanthobacteraceae bacterium]